MTAEQASIVIRRAVPADAVSLNQILSAIIAIGGTTAFQSPLTETEFSDNFIEGDNCIVCFVAERTIDKQLIGFQALSKNNTLPNDWVDIATYSRPEPRTPGVGSALFRRTKAAARDLGIVAINATIRADNHCGLPYYEKMGFRTYDILKDVLLQDGTPVDRIKKRFLVV